MTHSCLISIYWEEVDPDLCLHSICNRMAAAVAGKEQRHAADGQVYHIQSMPQCPLHCH